MNRRLFLSSLAAAVAGATLDPERLLWVPGKKLISIPAQRDNSVFVPSGGYLYFLSDNIDYKCGQLFQRDGREWKVISRSGNISVSIQPQALFMALKPGVAVLVDEP